MEIPTLLHNKGIPTIQSAILVLLQVENKTVRNALIVKVIALEE